jgi:putative peptide zinc metalloprotease protein
MTAPEFVEPRPAPRPHDEPLVLADGLELIGEYEGSGFKEPPLLARRSDGQMIKLRRLPYLIAAAANGERDAGDIAALVSEHYPRSVTGRDVNYLVERTLRPLGVLARPDGTTPKLPKRAPVMALRHRRPVIPEGGVNFIARGFSWLHRPPVQTLLLLALGAFDAWLFGVHGIAGGLRAVLYNPALLLGVMASIVVATAFHEIGHASACRYGGARPGVIGVGIYLVWPAFYCDVTDAYRLNRIGRLRTDLGGVYFNGIFALLAGAAGLATGEEALMLVAFVQHTIVLQQLLPLLRFDGYYVLSDLTGVPDILSRIKPIFGSLLPWHRPEPAVDELKPWVRVVVTVYLALLVPALTFMIVSTVLAAPRIFATAYDSLGLQLDRVQAAAGAAEIALGTVQIGALIIPIAAMTVSVMRSGRMATRGLFSWSRGSVPRRAAALAAIAAVAGGAAWAWWPNTGNYQPIRPGERGTVGEALSTMCALPGGHSSVVKAPETEPATPATGERSPQPPARVVGAPPPDGAEAPPPAGDGGDGPAGAGDDGDPAAPDEPGAEPTTTPAPQWPSATPGPASNAIPSPTPMPSASATPGATDTPAASPTPNATATETPTATATPAASPTPTSTSDVAASPTADSSPSAAATPTPTP